MDVIVQTVANGLVAGSAHGLIALSFGLIYNTRRFFNLAHAVTYTIGAYAAFMAVQVLGASSGVAVLVGATAAAMVGFAVDSGIYRPIRNRGGTPLVLLLTSIGIMVTLQNCVSLIFGDELRSMPSLDTGDGMIILGARITEIQLVTVGFALAAYVFLYAFLRWTWAGRRVRMVVDNEELSRAVGVNADRVAMWVFVGGSALAGVAATLAGYDIGLRPMMGFQALLMGVVALVVGGIGNISGAYLGGLVVGAAQQVAAWVLPSKWQEAVVFAILVVFLLLRPQGILGTQSKKVFV